MYNKKIIEFPNILLFTVSKWRVKMEGNIYLEPMLDLVYSHIIFSYFHLDAQHTQITCLEPSSL